MLAKRFAGRAADGERGQILVLFIVMMSVFFVIAAITIDYSLWLSERRGIARASDLSALAGAQDLPADPINSGPFTSRAACNAPAEEDVTHDPCKAAFDWAARNGYGAGSGITVAVNFFCGNTLSNAIVTNINSHNLKTRVCFNEAQGNPNFFLSPCPSVSGEKGCDAINVSIKKGATTLFSAFSGGVGFNIGFSSWGNVTFKLIPTDSVVVMDRSGSMGDSPCSGANNQVGCKIHEAKVATNNFIDFLVNGSNVTKVGFAPFTDCYNPPHAGGPNVCIPAPTPNNVLTAINCDTPGASQVACLNTNTAVSKTLINGLVPGGATNICNGLLEGRKVLRGPGNQRTGAGANPNPNPDAKRFVVVVSDGENVYQASSNAANALDPLCRPANPALDGGSQACNVNRSVSNASLDLKTLQLATSMKAAGIDNDVEIFTIQVYSACVPSNTIPSPAACDAIGQTTLQTGEAGSRLLKCMASSTLGTNDHYFKTNNAATLGDIFQIVALQIAGRGLTAGPSS